MIGIVGAMIEEIEMFLEILENKVEQKIANRTFYFGNIGNKKVVITFSGIGMVASSITTTIMCQFKELDYLVFTGVAGSTNKDVNICDVVISKDLIEYGFDTTAFGYKKGEIPRLKESTFVSNNKFYEKLKNVEIENNIHFGRIVSSDKFIDSKLEKEMIGNEFSSLCVDMESAAFAHVCQEFNKEFVVIRSISDSLTDESTLEYDKFVKIAVKNNYKMVVKLLEI